MSNKYIYYTHVNHPWYSTTFTPVGMQSSFLNSLNNNAVSMLVVAYAYVTVYV